MIIRNDTGGQWIVTQPAHAWVAAQLAIAWGNAQFAAPSPREDVVLGTTMHDIGWLAWETRPSLNLETGLPHTFMELSTTAHLDIWEPASRIALPFGRYAALLVSLHATYLYGFHNYERDSPDEARRAREFVSREMEMQRVLIDSLREDPSSRVHAIERNRRLVALWDGMSLAICGNTDRDRTFTVAGAGANGGDTDIVLTPTASGFALRPWPLSVEVLALRVDALRLDRTFSDQDELDSWFASSVLETIEIHIDHAE